MPLSNANTERSQLGQKYVATTSFATNTRFSQKRLKIDIQTRQRKQHIQQDSPSSSSGCLQFVQALPSAPIPNGHYIFANRKRESLTNYNHGLHKYPAKFIPQIARWGLLHNCN